MNQIIRTPIELFLWTLALSVITTLSSCDKDSAQQAAQQEAGTKQECALTTQGKVCRSPNGISNLQNDN